MALCYDGTDVRLHRYIDFDFASDVDSRKRITSYVFTLESGAVICLLRPQKVVTLSMTEAAYVAATETCKELILKSPRGEMNR